MMMFRLAVVFLALVSVAQCQMMAAQEGQQANEGIHSFLEKVTAEMTAETHETVDYVLDLFHGGGGPSRMSIEGKMVQYVGKQRGIMIKKLIKMFEDLMEWLELQIKNGIAISQQLLDMCAEAMRLLLSGEMPPMDIITSIIVEVLGLIGRKKREADAAAGVIQPSSMQLVSSWENRGLSYMQNRPAFTSLSAEQQERAKELIKSAIKILFERNGNGEPTPYTDDHKE